MNTAVTAPKSFEEKMKDRIKDSIGDLITDEQLTLLIERSMKEVFFDKTYKPNPNGYGNKLETDPFIHTLVKELLTERMNAMVAEHIKTRADDLKAIMEQVVKDGAGALFLHAITRQFEMPLATLQMSIQSAMQMHNHNPR